MTKAERKLWFDFLRYCAPKLYRQRPIDHYIVDFYCANSGLVIEVDGSQHYTDEGVEFDAIRTEVLEIYGLTVLRFTNIEVMTNFENVCTTIASHFHEKPPLTGEVARSAGGVINDIICQQPLCQHN